MKGTEDPHFQQARVSGRFGFSAGTLSAPLDTEEEEWKDLKEIGEKEEAARRD